MINDPFAGRPIGVPERSRMLVATEDGVFLWPGDALVLRRGNGFFAADPRGVNNLTGAFFGPSAIYTPIQTVLERACDLLREGQTGPVQRMLDRLPLPPVSPNGERLMRAIASRQGLALPDVAVATERSGTVWGDGDIEIFAQLHDRMSARAHALEKIFNPSTAWDPAKHPRWPAGQSDGGEFQPGDGAGSGGASPIQPVALARPPIDDLLGDPPKIPGKEPSGESAKNDVRKEVAWWLARAALTATDAPAAVVVGVRAAVEAALWLAPYVHA